MPARETQPGRAAAQSMVGDRPRDLSAFLHTQGVRATAQRVVILQSVRDAPGHLTAEEIYQQVRERLPGLSVVSVYRTLKVFGQRGIVTRTRLGERAAQWEWRMSTAHHHAVCQSCGQSQEISGALFTNVVAQLQHEYGFQADLHHMALWGICGACTPVSAPTGS